MTNREFFQAVITLAEVESNSDYVVELFNKKTEEMETFTMAEIKAHAEEGIEKLDKRNNTRSSKPSKTQLENETYKAKILEMMTAEPNRVFVASEMGTLLEVSTSKASALLRQLVEGGLVYATEQKVKHGKVKAYGLVG